MYSNITVTLFLSVLTQLYKVVGIHTWGEIDNFCHTVNHLLQMLHAKFHGHYIIGPFCEIMQCMDSIYITCLLCLILQVFLLCWSKTLVSWVHLIPA